MGYIDWLVSSFLFLILITTSYIFLQGKIKQIKEENFEVEYYSLKLLEKLKSKFENETSFLNISLIKNFDYKELKNFIGYAFNIQIGEKEIFPVILDGEIYTYTLPLFVQYENGSFGIEKVIFKFSK
jgi:hypothetical protein